MNRFDNRINSILEEAGLFRNIASGVASGIEAAKNPSAGVKTIFNSLDTLSKLKQENMKQSFSLKNQPKLNQIVVTTAPIIGINKTTEFVIFGKITKAMDSSGNYGVALTDEKGNPSQKYVFAKTQEIPYWQVYDKTKLPNPVNDLEPENDPNNLFEEPQGGGEGEGETKDQEILDAIVTGPAKVDVAPQLKLWRDYREYLNSQKK